MEDVLFNNSSLATNNSVSIIEISNDILEDTRKNISEKTKPKTAVKNQLGKWN